MGKASADILAAPEKHQGKTYKLVGPAFSLEDLSVSFTKALKTDIAVIRVPYEAAKEAFMGMGFPEWQTDGILELYKSIDSGSDITNEKDIGDIEKITGEKAMDVDGWVTQNAAGFE